MNVKGNWIYERGGNNLKFKIYIGVFILFILPFFCLAESKIIYSDDLIKQYPSDPATFQKRYGGVLKYHKANTKIMEKGANSDSAFISGNGFKVDFWKAKDYYIFQITITKKNRITIGGIDVIGKTRNEIISIFGNPTP